MNIIKIFDLNISQISVNFKIKKKSQNSLNFHQKLIKTTKNHLFHFILHYSTYILIVFEKKLQKKNREKFCEKNFFREFFSENFSKKNREKNRNFPEKSKKHDKYHENNETYLCFADPHRPHCIHNFWKI
jgi:hypothetical protein